MVVLITRHILRYWSVDSDRHFNCRVSIKQAFLGEEKVFEFTDNTTARDFQLLN